MPASHRVSALLEVLQRSALRHERDRNVGQEIALAEGIVGVGLPVEAVVVLFGHAKSSTPVEHFKLCNEPDGASYFA
jgi:hypothetical protein